MPYIDVNLQQFVINKLPQAIYDTLLAGGQINSNEYYIITDNDMPTPTVDFLGSVLQYQGATTQTYTQGYFYICVLSGGNYIWQQINVQPTLSRPQVIDLVSTSITISNVDAGTDYNYNILNTLIISANDTSPYESTISFIVGTLSSIDTSATTLIKLNSEPTWVSGKVGFVSILNNCIVYGQEI